MGRILKIKKIKDICKGCEACMVCFGFEIEIESVWFVSLFSLFLLDVLLGRNLWIYPDKMPSKKGKLIVQSPIAPSVVPGGHKIVAFMACIGLPCGCLQGLAFA